MTFHVRTVLNWSILSACVCFVFSAVKGGHTLLFSDASEAFEEEILHEWMHKKADVPYLLMFNMLETRCALNF